MSNGMEALVASSAKDDLAQFLAIHYPEFARDDEHGAKLSGLTDEKAAVLQKVLESEIRGEATFTKRNSDINDFYSFDLSLNALFSEIMASKLPVAPL
ncbi:MAG: hypothetical protein RIR97_1254, partial [Pseudomonadota bacterium]